MEVSFLNILDPLDDFYFCMDKMLSRDGCQSQMFLKITCEKGNSIEQPLSVLHQYPILMSLFQKYLERIA